MRTLSGAEVLAPAPGYGALGATIVKARDVAHLAGVPDMPVLARTRHANGYVAADMVHGWWDWEEVVRTRGGWYLLANEPNHSHDRLAPVEWLAEAVEALEAIGHANHRYVLLPGLQPYHQVGDWLTVYERLETLYPSLAGRGIHIYWQGAHNYPAAVAYGKSLRRPGAVNVVAEYGDSGHEIGIDTAHRIDNTRLAAVLMRGEFDAITYFAHNGNGDPQWEPFVFPIDEQAGIVSLGKSDGPAPVQPSPPTPTPPGGDPVANPNPLGYEVGPGILAEAAKRGLTVRSDELWTDPTSRGRYSVVETFEGPRIYWSDRTGVVVSDPPR